MGPAPRGRVPPKGNKNHPIRPSLTISPKEKVCWGSRSRFGFAHDARSRLTRTRCRRRRHRSAASTAFRVAPGDARAARATSGRARRAWGVPVPPSSYCCTKSSEPPSIAASSDVSDPVSGLRFDDLLPLAFASPPSFIAVGSSVPSPSTLGASSVTSRPSCSLEICP